MTDKELKEAVESLSNLADHCHIVDMFEAEKLLRKQIIPFLNIYLSREDKAYWKATDHICNYPIRDIAQAIHKLLEEK